MAPVAGSQQRQQGSTRARTGESRGEHVVRVRMSFFVETTPTTKRERKRIKSPRCDTSENLRACVSTSKNACTQANSHPSTQHQETGPSHLSPPLQVPVENGQEPGPCGRGHLQSVELGLEPSVQGRHPDGVELVKRALVRLRESSLQRGVVLSQFSFMTTG